MRDHDDLSLRKMSEVPCHEEVGDGERLAKSRWQADGEAQLSSGGDIMKQGLDEPMVWSLFESRINQGAEMQE